MDGLFNENFFDYERFNLLCNFIIFLLKFLSKASNLASESDKVLFIFAFAMYCEAGSISSKMLARENSLKPPYCFTPAKILLKLF